MEIGVVFMADSVKKILPAIQRQEMRIEKSSRSFVKFGL